MDIDELKMKYSDEMEKLNKIIEALNLDEKKKRIQELEEKTMSNDFWQDSKNSSLVLGEIKSLKNIIEKNLPITLKKLLCSFIFSTLFIYQVYFTMICKKVQIILFIYIYIW